MRASFLPEPCAVPRLPSEGPGLSPAGRVPLRRGASSSHLERSQGRSPSIPRWPLPAAKTAGMAL